MKSKILTLALPFALGAALLLPSAANAQPPHQAEPMGDLTAESPAPHWLESAVIYEANLRQGTPTRDLKGLRQELVRLRDLGVDVIWLMPIHPISEKERKGGLGSYYAVQDYYGVNPEFGTLDDLKDFVDAAHDLGMKVILDEVCNHTGADHAWIAEHPDYYALDENGEMYGPYDWTDVRKLDYANPDTRQAMTDALAYWIREADIDGYRCDVAGEVLTEFWEEARPKLQEVKPGLMMLAESSKPELLLKAFDVDYAWPMKDTFNAIAFGKGVNKYAEHSERKPMPARADAIQALLERQSREYPQGSIHMNMITNHDLNSWEGTEFERFGPGVEAFAVLSYTLPGVPMMYTGQEVGFDHAFEFYDQDPEQPVYAPNYYTDLYTRLNGLKHANRALDAHSPINFIETGNTDVIAFTRSADAVGNRVTVIANLSSEESTFSLPDGAMNPGNAVDWKSEKSASVPTSLEPWKYVIIVNNEQ